MGDFLTVPELPSYLQVPSVDTTTANLLIGMAEASVRVYCGWNISAETVTNQVVEPVGYDLFLPTLRLTAVASIVDNGVTLDAATAYQWRSNGHVRLRSRSSLSWWPPQLTVTYTHGLAAGAKELTVVKQVVASAVSRLIGNPSVLQQMQVGDVMEQYAVAPQVPAGLLYSEQAALGSFRLYAIA